MGQISVTGLETWTVQRILGFFNRAHTTKDLIEGILKDDPGTGTGKYVIGEVVARRILDRRNVLVGRRFSSLEQLNGIQGMGRDKFHDLVYTFRLPAAEAFREALFAGPLGENWQVEAHASRFENAQEFRDLVDTPTVFQNWLTSQIGEIATQKYALPHAVAEAGRRLQDSFPVRYRNGHLGAYALTFWLYRFNQAHCFRFEDILPDAHLYLDFMPYAESRIELRMFVGFDNHGLLADNSTVNDLPVVINYGEQAVTIWTAQLKD